MCHIERSIPESIWGAHEGCGILAKLFLANSDHIPDAVRQLLLAQASQTKAPIPPVDSTSESMPLPAFREAVVDALAPNADNPRAIGHDVIFTSYILRALDEFEIMPWASLGKAVGKLVHDIKQAGPGWVSINNRQEFQETSHLSADDAPPSWETIVQFDRPLPMEAGDMQLGHLLTHAHAITRIAPLCSSGLNDKFRCAFGKRLTLLRTANQQQHDQTPLRKWPLDPRTERYWACPGTLGDMHGHVAKYALSFLELCEHTPTTADLEAFGRILWPAASIDSLS